MEVKGHGLVLWTWQSIFNQHIKRPTQVVNNLNVDRIHMIVQAHIGNKREQFNELLDRSNQKYGIQI